MEKEITTTAYLFLIMGGLLAVSMGLLVYFHKKPLSKGKTIK